MKKVNIDDLQMIYNTILVNYFISFLCEEDKERFEEINDVLFNENNYYALFEKTVYSYDFTLLLLDTKNNIMYAIVSEG